MGENELLARARRLEEELIGKGMSEIGDDVVVLRHPMVRKGGRSIAVLFILGPIMATLMVIGADLMSNAPIGTGHLPLVAAGAMLGGYLVSALIALPGLLMRRRERLTEELRVNNLGMELRQILPGVEDERSVVCWRIDWADVTQAKLRYRASDRTFEAVDIRTRTGMEQSLYATAWEPVGGRSPADEMLRRAVMPVDSDALRATSLVKTLSAGGLQIEDDVPRPQDRFATWVGLGLGAAAIISALIFSYFVEH